MESPLPADRLKGRTSGITENFPSILPLNPFSKETIPRENRAYGIRLHWTQRSRAEERKQGEELPKVEGKDRTAHLGLPTGAQTSD